MVLKWYSSIQLVFVFLIAAVSGYGQRTQTITGQVADKESKAAIAGAVVTIAGATPILGAVSDSNGHFSITDVPLGKQQISISLVGYKPVKLADIPVTSAKQVLLTIEMEEEVVSMKEVVVSHRREHINDMALVSTKTFDVQETERYAGSRADPARMASNFAGVQGGNDSRNDIVIRGNSPQGVLWRLEGVDIPNPNHFAIPGTSGGPVSMLNSKTLANSDFFTGAFPAEYGGAVAGVFDLRLRAGNANRFEFTGQLGFLGTELFAEGPLSLKKRSSFLVAYRYSTLQLFEGFHIKIGTSSVPKYQDLTFKLNFPLGKKDNLEVFGIGGLSNIDLIVSTLKQPEPELYGESDRDQYFTSNTGVIGVGYNDQISASTFTRLTVAVTDNSVFAHHNKVFRDAAYQVDSFKNILGYNNNTAATNLHWLLSKKISARQTLKFGIINNYYLLSYVDSSMQYPTSRQDWQHRSDFKGSTDLLQGYVQYKFKPSDHLTLNGGLHAQYLSHNGSAALEPRLSMRWLLAEGNIITAGYGLHSQPQPLYQYFAHLPQNPADELHNYHIGFTRSHHVVVAYEHVLSRDLKMKLESYYQYLFQVPIEKRIGSSYSALNQGSSFTRDFPGVLQNTGTGYNYGGEVTLEKRMTHGYYFLLTGSLFDAKARGNDGVYRSTDFNTTYATNLLCGYERKVSRYNTFIAGVKITALGGKLYSPIDTGASNKYGDAVVVDSLRNTLHLKPYFRADLKLGVKFNSKAVTHELALDLVNLFGNKNELSYTYSSDLAAQGNAQPYYKQYQLGFLPIFYYRIDFAVHKR